MQGAVDRQLQSKRSKSFMEATLAPKPRDLNFFQVDAGRLAVREMYPWRHTGTQANVCSSQRWKRERERRAGPLHAIFFPLKQFATYQDITSGSPLPCHSLESLSPCASQGLRRRTCLRVHLRADGHARGTWSGAEPPEVTVRAGTGTWQPRTLCGLAASNPWNLLAGQDELHEGSCQQ